MKWILKILPLLLSILTPELKKMLQDFIVQFKQKAAQTKNPWDDIAAELLDDLFNG